MESKPFLNRGSESVPIDSILAEDTPYGLRFDYGDPALETSLQKWGMLFPLWLVRRQGGGRAKVIAGHKRFFAALKHKWKTVPAVRVEEKFSEKELFFLSLYSNWNQKGSDLDRMRALGKAGKVFGLSTDELLSEVLPVLGLPSTRGILRAYHETAQLCSQIHALIHEGKLPFRGASSLARFSDDDQLWLAREVFSRVHLTANQLVLIAEWLFDLKKRGGSIERMTRDEGIEKTLCHPRLPLKKKGEKLFDSVRRLRFPRLAREESRFEQLRRQVEKNKNVSLSHPAGFEAPGIRLNTQLSNREDLRRVIRFLEDHSSSFESFLP